jgi:hypothetical protein
VGKNQAHADPIVPTRSPRIALDPIFKTNCQRTSKARPMPDFLLSLSTLQNLICEEIRQNPQTLPGAVGHLCHGAVQSA